MTEPIDQINDLAKTAELATQAMGKAAMELCVRDAQIEIAIDALLAIASGSTDPRTVAGRAVVQMRELNK